MGTTAPKDTTTTDAPATDEATPDAPAAEDALGAEAPAADASAPDADPPAGDEPAADPPAAPDDDAKDDATADADGTSTLRATIQGGLITLSGTGFEPGTRYDVRFQRPDGSIDNTLATATDEGSLTTYATVKATGKHLAWLEKAGEKVAQLKFKV